MPTVATINTFNTKNKKQNEKQCDRAFWEGKGEDENIEFDFSDLNYYDKFFSITTEPLTTIHDTSILEF